VTTPACTAIKPVEFDEAIGSAHYVDDDAHWLVADRLGMHSPSELSEDQVLAALRAWQCGGRRPHDLTEADGGPPVMERRQCRAECAVVG
jgi:hypothetical protein